jgi:hypothetical protein
MSRRNASVGLVLCAMCFLLAGLVFLGVGILFFVAPESLRDAGFRRDPTPGIRVAGLLMFAGAGALLAWPAWGLIRLRPFAFEIARALALALAVLSLTRIVGGASYVFDWLVLVAGGAVAGYLTLPSVRALLRP